MLRLDMHMIAGVLQYVAVASFAEAWIENVAKSPVSPCKRSPPSRRRGLKKLKITHETIANQSPPSRRRGLKN